MLRRLPLEWARMSLSWIVRRRRYEGSRRSSVLRFGRSSRRAMPSTDRETCGPAYRCGSGPRCRRPEARDRDMVQTMKPGAVLVDIAIDQGGCFETSHPTSHSSPTYVVDGVVHYCVANMPAAVSRTATFALNNVTLPFTIALADKGWRKALLENSHLRAGLNIHDGQSHLPARRRGSRAALHNGGKCPLVVLPDTDDRGGGRPGSRKRDAANGGAGGELPSQSSAFWRELGRFP